MLGICRKGQKNQEQREKKRKSLSESRHGSNIVAFCGRKVNEGKRHAEEKEEAGCRDGSAAASEESGAGTSGRACDSGQAEKAGETQEGLARRAVGRLEGCTPGVLCKSAEEIEGKVDELRGPAKERGKEHPSQNSLGAR